MQSCRDDGGSGDRPDRLAGARRLARRPRALAHSLADAFWDDPVSNWASPHDGARPGVLRRFFGTQLGHKLPAGFVYTDEARTGAAVWAPPKTWRTTPRQDLQLMRAFAHPRHWPRAPIVAHGLLGLERAHPPEPPHFYLATLGVRRRRRARASARA